MENQSAQGLHNGVAINHPYSSLITSGTRSGDGDGNPRISEMPHDTTNALLVKDAENGFTQALSGVGAGLKLRNTTSSRHTSQDKFKTSTIVSFG
jgi:hypothetical protein